MDTPSRRHWAWLRSGPAWSMAAVVAFVVAAGLARFNPAWGQAGSDKKPDSKGSPTRERGDAKSKKKATPALVVPGAGTKADAAGLAKIIDQEVQKRLDEEKVKASALSDDAE